MISGIRIRRQVRLTAAFALLLVVAAVACDNPEPVMPNIATPTTALVQPPINPESRAAYDGAAEVLQDGTLSYSDRRNRLRLVRRSFGDDLFFKVVQDVPVYDAATGRTVTFAEYMADLAGTFVGHPNAPITFDPVGAATRIYFSPTEDTVRRMTGIGITEKRVAEYANLYRGEERERQQTREVAKAPPPAFVSRDPELKESYERAREIFTNPNETQQSRREKIRVMQQDVGLETMTLLLRYVPIIDLERGTVQTFDDYARSLVESYDSGSGSPIARDPVGAGMSLLFDPSPDNIAAMTGIGLSGDERREVSERYEREQVDVFKEANRIVADTASQFDWEEVHQDVKKATDDLERDIDRASEDIGRATDDAISNVISILGGN